MDSKIQTVNPIPLEEIFWSFEKFIKITESSPSKIHYGNYKSMLKNPSIMDNTYQIILISINMETMTLKK